MKSVVPLDVAVVEGDAEPALPGINGYLVDYPRRQAVRYEHMVAFDVE